MDVPEDFVPRSSGKRSENAKIYEAVKERLKDHNSGMIDVSDKRAGQIAGMSWRITQLKLASRTNTLKKEGKVYLVFYK
jgi:hypothetical protein